MMPTWVSAYFLKYGTLMQLLVLAGAKDHPEADQQQQLHQGTVF